MEEPRKRIATEMSDWVSIPTLAAIGAVTSAPAVLIRLEGYVTWVGDRAQPDVVGRHSLVLQFGHKPVLQGVHLTGT